MPAVNQFGSKQLVTTFHYTPKINDNLRELGTSSIFNLPHIHFDYNGNMEKEYVVNALASLAHLSRLDIFRLLVQAGPAGMPAGKISEATGIPPSTISFHLKEMSHSDMVNSRHESRFVIYSVNFTTMNALLEYLTENCCGGNPCVSVSEPACSNTEECSS